MKNRILNIGLALLAMIFVVACSEDDFTGDSTMQATAPNLSVDLDFSNTETLVEDGSTYNFTVSISEPQIADVVVYLTQTGGDATEGNDFLFPHSVTIPKGATSASGTITILSDELIEENETVELTIGMGSESNVAAVNSETVTFNIGNLEEGDLMVNLDWSLSAIATDHTGAELGATDLADLRLLLTDVPYDTIINSADGAGFESLTISDTLADGEYYIVADFYSAMSHIDRDLNLTLEFNQAGVINHETYSFPGALNTTVNCPDEYYVMAKVTKSGDNYTIEPVSEKSVIDLNDYVGAWTGQTSYDHESEVVTSLNSEGNLEITGIGVGFMTMDWGEVITNMETLVIEDIDLETGEFSIPETYYMTTTYEGAVQPDYNLSATGTFDKCSGTLTIDYDFIQDGTSYTEYLTVGNGWPPFEENDLTLE